LPRIFKIYEPISILNEVSLKQEKDLHNFEIIVETSGLTGLSLVTQNQTGRILFWWKRSKGERDESGERERAKCT